MRKYVSTGLAACAVLLIVTVAFAAPARADVSAAEDNPPGCTTVEPGASGDQCGAQGRNGFGTAGHLPPIEACKDTRAASGSLVTRVLPDGPRRADGSLAFISGACVYLPPGYASGALRYPTLYLLHGGGGDQGNWVTAGGIQKILDDAYAADPTHAVIAVMPDGHDGNWHDYADETFMIEQYVLRHVVPYVDAHFRTIANRQGRAIAGLSNGGYGALLFAAKAPDMFIAAGGMSSNLGARGMESLDTPWFPSSPLKSQEAGAFYYGNVPISLVPNLDGVNVTMDLGELCSSQDDLSSDLCIPFLLEAAFKYDNEAFRDEMNAQHHVGAFEYRETEGSHAWRWWSLWLRDRHLPFIWKFLAKPQPTSAPVAPTPVPASFRYRSIAPTFSVFGYRFAVERPEREFLDVALKDNSLTLTGTGVVDVTVPDGRHFSVDLGPGHDAEQYSAQARVHDAAGQYSFVTKTIDVTPSSVEGSRAIAVEALPATGGSAEPLAAAVLLVVAALAARRLRVAAAARAV
ncbi:MAG: hypothetical protein QOF21_1142 [Actinomycetota bacterium]|jgi:S-formylglutathione hydrolase FrmB